MPFSYLEPKRICALRLAQIKGTDTTSLETAYTDTSIVTMLDGAEIPPTAFQDAILYIAKEIAQTIADNPSHPDRSFLYARTSALADNSSTPTVDNNGAEIIGQWDSCADSSTSVPLTWQPTQTISDCLNSFFDDTDIFYYNITGNYIRCTRPSVYLQGCSWDNTAQIALYIANGNCPLPQSTLSVLCDGVTERAAQVGWTDGAASAPYYSQLYRQGLAQIAMGSSVPLSSTNMVSG